MTRIGDRRLLEGQDGFESQRAQMVRDDVRSGPAVPLGDHNKDLLVRWHALALQRALPYDHAWDPTGRTGIAASWVIREALLTWWGRPA